MPWIFILVLAAAAAVALVYDWRHDKLAFAHITRAKDMIRSESGDQMRRRLRRQASKGQAVFVIQSTTVNGKPLLGNSKDSTSPPPAAANGSVAGHRPPPPPPNAPKPAAAASQIQAARAAAAKDAAVPVHRLVPEVPKTGLVQQMKQKLEMKK